MIKNIIGTFNIILVLMFIQCTSNENKDVINQETSDVELTESVDTTTNLVQIEEPKDVEVAENEANNLDAIISDILIEDGKVWRSDYDSIREIWRNVNITRFGVKKNLKVGEEVQIIPLRKELHPLTLSVKSSEFRDEEIESWYEIMLEPINNVRYAQIKSLPDIREEFACDVAIVHPPFEDCKLLDNSTLNESDLPKNVSTEIIKIALDLDNNSSVDVLVLKFCCSDRKPMDYESCDYTCGETYIKVKSKWIMIDSSQPM